MIEIIFAYLATIVEDPYIRRISKKDYEILEFSKYYELVFKDGTTEELEKYGNYIEFQQDRILSYPTFYFCNIDKKNVYVYETQKGFALNTHVIKKTQHSVFPLNPVHFIDIAGTYTYRRTDYYFSFVFNVVDMRKIYTDLSDKLLESLPFEMIIRIFSFLNFTKKGNGLYTVSDFPFNFLQEFEGEIPKVLSKIQLKKLYEIGAIKLAYKSVSSFNTLSGQLTQMTDESYEHVYPNNAQNLLQKIFKSKEEMNLVRDSFLEKFFY